MTRIIVALLCCVLGSRAQEVSAPKPVLKNVSFSELPPLIQSKSARKSDLRKTHIPNYPQECIDFIGSELFRGYLKKQTKITNYGKFVQQSFDELQTWASGYIRESDFQKNGSDPLFPILTTQTLAHYYLPLAYLDLEAKKQGVTLSMWWNNMCADTLISYIRLYNVPKLSYSQHRIQIDGYPHEILGTLASNVAQTMINMNMTSLPETQTECRIKAIESDPNELNLISTNEPLRDMIANNYSIQDLSQCLLGHTPESMTFVDAMTLYGVYLAWSKANQDTDLSLDVIQQVVANLINRDVRLSIDDPLDDSNGLTLDQYVKEFSDEVSKVVLTVKITRKRPREDEDYGILDLFSHEVLSDSE